MARLGDICFRITDGSHNPPNGIVFSNYIMLSSKNVDDDRITTSEPRYLSKEAYQSENKRTNITESDLLMTIVGTVGRVAVVPNNLSGVCVQRSVAVLKPNDEVINNRYLMYQLQSMRPFLEKEARGVAQKGLYLKQVSNLSVLVPEKEKQFQVVKTLDKVTSLISLHKQQFAKLDELIKSRFMEMFGDPIANEKNWHTQSLERVCKNIVDCPHSTPHYTNEDTGFMCIRTSIVKKNQIMWDEVEYIPENEYYQRIQRKRPEKGDIVYTREGAILGIAAVIDRECNVALGQRSMLLSPHPEYCCSEFLCVAMNFDSFLNMALMGISGSASPHLNVGDIKVFEIILPPLEEQRRFAAFTKQIDKSKYVIRQSLEQLEMLKKSLMQKYFG